MNRHKLKKQEKIILENIIKEILITNLLFVTRVFNLINLKDLKAPHGWNCTSICSSSYSSIFCDGSRGASNPSYAW